MAGTSLTTATAKDWLKKLADDSLKDALPKMVDPDKFNRVALTTMRKNPDLFKCSPASIAASLVQSAQLGLTVDGVLGMAYLIPFKTECTLIIGYKGLIELVRRSGEVSTLAMECVYDGDDFSYTLGLDPKLHHVPGDEHGVDDSKITHAYVAVKMKDGSTVFNVWSIKKLIAHRDRYSKGAGRSDSPWRTAPSKMYVKTIMRGLINSGRLPLSIEHADLARQAISMEEMIEARSTVIDSRVVGRKTLDDLAGATDPGEDLEKAIDAIRAAGDKDSALAAVHEWAVKLPEEMEPELNAVYEERLLELGS